jgi:hypothetical protein
MQGARIFHIFIFHLAFDSAGSVANRRVGAQARSQGLAWCPPTTVQMKTENENL